MGNRTVHIHFGGKTGLASFRLVWSHLALAEQQVRFASSASLLKITGMTLTAPSDETEPDYASRVRHGRSLRCHYTPATTSSAAPEKSFFKYEQIGTGSFAVVSRVVDLRTGELWALKEIKPGAYSDAYKAVFRHEVEIMDKVRHGSQPTTYHLQSTCPDTVCFQENIVHFESWQDFRIGGSFQLFYRLYRGNLDNLIPTHKDCGSPSKFFQPPWAEKMFAQMCSALDYLHKEGYLHRDVKPSNILYDLPGPNFYLADFGIGTLQETAGKGKAGSPFYMAPEACFGEGMAAASDIWSLGMTLGVLLGYWCWKEYAMTDREWANKLLNMGSNKTYCVADADVEDEGEIEAVKEHRVQSRWYRHLEWIVNANVLPPAIRPLLASEPEDRPTAEACRKNTGFKPFTKKGNPGEPPTPRPTPRLRPRPTPPPRRLGRRMSSNFSDGYSSCDSHAGQPSRHKKPRIA